MTHTRFFQGQTPSHPAFILNPAEALSLSKTKGAAQFIFPWVKRHEVFHATCLNRSVIDVFGVRTEQQLRTAAPDLADWLAERVKPAREEAARKRSSDPRTKEQEVRRYKALAERWWQLQHRRGEMVHGLNEVQRFLVVPRYRQLSAGQRHLAAFVCGTARPGDDLLVVASGDIEMFGVLSSKWLPVLLERARDAARKGRRAAPLTASQTLILALTSTSRQEIVKIATEILNVRNDSRRLELPLGRLYDWDGFLPLVPELQKLHEHLDAAVHRDLVASGEEEGGPCNSDPNDEVDGDEDAKAYVDLCTCRRTDTLD